MVQAINKKLTLQEFLALPEGDVTYELVKGEAIAKMSAKRFHSNVAVALCLLLTSWVQERGEMAAKATAYLHAGVLRVWVIDTQAKSITVFYPDAPPQTFIGATPLVDITLDGLTFSPEQVFQKAGIAEQ